MPPILLTLLALTGRFSNTPLLLAMNSKPCEDIVAFPVILFFAYRGLQAMTKIGSLSCLAADDLDLSRATSFYRHLKNKMSNRSDAALQSRR